MHSSEVSLAPHEVAVLVPAAGRGRRLGGTPKQFRTLGEAPLLAQVLLVFERHPRVGHLVVAAPAGQTTDVARRLRPQGLDGLTAVVEGGDSRQASVRNALRAVPASVKVVLVHDAARPFVSAAQVQAVVQSAATAGAASLAVPVADTLRRGDEATLGETVPREGLYRMQTPQAARREWLETAHRRAVAQAGAATDDVGLLQQAGYEVHLVRGHRRNFKITTPEDWALAQRLWPTWQEDPARHRHSWTSSE
jgi:2-C-methyl-D-erythritol 4-phosphate cytidylyltransferase